MSAEPISAVSRCEKKRVRVLDSEIAYVEAGAGDPIVFIHGNPTSSYLWRNVIPHLEHLGRCLAPDLIGMGDSGRMPSGDYRYIEHARYLDAWFEALGLTSNVIMVLHDWGGALGFYRTYRHPEQVAAIAYAEVMVRPRLWSDMPEEAVRLFKAMRSSPEGERMVLQENFFVETMLFKRGIVRELGAEEKAVYRAPFLEPGESRRPTLQWAREIPFEGEPADNYAIVKAYSDFISVSEVPKLFINAELGHALAGAARDFCRGWKNQREVSFKGRHFLPEDFPHEMGAALAQFVRQVRG